MLNRSLKACNGTKDTTLKSCVENIFHSYSSILLNTSHTSEHKVFMGAPSQGLVNILYPPPGSVQFSPEAEYRVSLNSSLDHTVFLFDPKFSVPTFNPSIIPQIYFNVPKSAGFGFIILEVSDLLRCVRKCWVVLRCVEMFWNVARSIWRCQDKRNWTEKRASARTPSPTTTGTVWPGELRRLSAVRPSGVTWQGILFVILSRDCSVTRRSWRAPLSWSRRR